MDQTMVWSDVNPAKAQSRDSTIPAVGGFSGVRKRASRAMRWV